MEYPDIVIKQFNEVKCKLDGDISILKQIQENYTYYAENYRFHPKFKCKMWDGKIKSLNLSDRTIDKGLIPNLVNFFNQNKISFHLDDNLFPKECWNFSDQDVYDFYKQIESPYEPKDYQVLAFKHAVNNNRSIILSPTASGKSYILYGLTKFYVNKGKKVLIILHRSALVKQLIEDNFVDEYDQNKNTFSWNTIYTGKEKETNVDVVCSTWQSIVNMPDEFFKQFDVVLGDEIHAFKAKSLIQIMSKCKHVFYRHGLTGTMDDIESNKILIEGIFGPPIQVAKTKQLINQGDISNLSIKCIVLQYQEEESKKVTRGLYNKDLKKYIKYTYREEIDFIKKHNKRNLFLNKIIDNLEGNILIAFRDVDHGKLIFNSIESDNKFYIDGSIKVDIRNEHQKQMDKSNNMIGVVSLGTFAEGINIKNVNYIILATPLKSKIKLLQLIGRGLRKSKRKDKVIFIDICDDLTYNKSKNYSYHHFLDRLKRYKSENFDVKIIKHKFK